MSILNMKRNLLTMFTAIAFLLGCDGPIAEETIGDIQLASSSKDVVEIKPEGGMENVRFSSALDWHVELSEEWLTVEPMEGAAGTARISIKADANETAETREAIVKICSEGVEVPVTVTQEPFIPTFELLDASKEITCLGGEFSISIYTDVEYEFHCEADWVTCVSTKAPRTRTLTFVAEPNPLPEERKALITFCAGTSCKMFTLTQRAAGTEADDWKKDQFVDRSLAMRFTATWCGYCPMMGTSFDMAKSQLPGQLELLSLHGDGSDYVFSGTATYIKRFSVSGFPTGVVDARATISNGPEGTTSATTVAVANETMTAYPAKSGIAIRSEIVDEVGISVEVDVYFKEADEYKVTVLLLEDGIVGVQNGANGSYTHNDVARLAMSSLSGDPVTVSEDYQVWSQRYTGTVRSAWNPENLKVLVYVEKPYGEQGKTKGVSSAKYGNYGDTYIDNCRAVKLGETAALELR